MLCCGALLFRTTYELIYQLKFVNIDDIRHNPEEPAYIELIEIVFHTWSVLSIVLMLLALGAKKSGGLWSTQQPFMQNPEAREGQDIPLEDMNVDPPAYSASPNSNNLPLAGATPPAVAGPAAPAPHDPPNDGDELGDHDRLVEGLGLGGTPSRYQPPIPQDDSYNTGIAVPITPAEAGPADGYGTGLSSQSPPGHEEVMGLNHQADGRPPVNEPLPYPEKH
jgi:hypothetical protein